MSDVPEELEREEREREEEEVKEKQEEETEREERRGMKTRHIKQRRVNMQPVIPRSGGGLISISLPFRLVCVPADLPRVRQYSVMDWAGGGGGGADCTLSADALCVMPALQVEDIIILTPLFT